MSSKHHSSGTTSAASHPGGTTASAASSTGGSTASTAAIANPSDPAALLLNILRSVDREVRSTLELDANALAVVQRFRDIDRALRVRPVAVPTASGITPRSGVAAGAASGSVSANP